MLLTDAAFCCYKLYHFIMPFGTFPLLVVLFRKQNLTNIFPFSLSPPFRGNPHTDKQRNENGQNNISVMGDQSNIDRARDMIDRIINDDRDREEHRRD